MIKSIQQNNNIAKQDYDNAQAYLKNQIKQPKNLTDLKRNANIKLR